MLVKDYGLVPLETREKNLNKFMQFCGIGYQMVSCQSLSLAIVETNLSAGEKRSQLLRLPCNGLDERGGWLVDGCQIGWTHGRGGRQRTIVNACCIFTSPLSCKVLVQNPFPMCIIVTYSHHAPRYCRAVISHIYDMDIGRKT